MEKPKCIYLYIHLYSTLCVNKYDTYLCTGAVAFSNAHFGAGVGPIYLDNVHCSGSESNLTDCSRSFTVSCNRGHHKDAGVRCQGRIVTSRPLLTSAQKRSCHILSRSGFTSVSAKLHREQPGNDAQYLQYRNIWRY